MINSDDTKTVILTKNQSDQIDMVKQRLSVLESEISNASKILKGIRSETDRAVKEKSYQEELLNNFTIKTKKAEATYKELLSNMDSVKESLLSDQKKAGIIRASNEKKTEELSHREKELIVKEKSHDKNVNDFNIKNEKFLKDRSSLEKAQSILLEAIKSISW